MPAFRRRYLVAFGVVLGLGLGLALAEVALRRPHPEDKNKFRLGDPVLHHRLRPNAVRPEQVGSKKRSAEIRTNALGFRDREYAAPKPPHVFRILMLGDSFTYGPGLRVEQTVPKVVEQRLAQTCARLHEVVNAGVPSYSPLLHYLLVKHVGLALDPDLIVLNFDMTDVRDDFIRTQLARFDRLGLPIAVPQDHYREAALLLPPLPGLLRPVDAVARHFAVYQELRKSNIGKAVFGHRRLDRDRLQALGLEGDLRFDLLAITRDLDTPAIREAWKLTTRYIVNIRDLARARAIPFVVVVYPHAHQVSASESPIGRSRVGIGPGLYASERPFEILEDLGRRETFPVINALRLFRERTRRDDPLFWPDDFHFTPRGASVLGEAIASGLRDRQLLSGCARDRASGGRRTPVGALTFTCRPSGGGAPRTRSDGDGVACPRGAGATARTTLTTTVGDAGSQTGGTMKRAQGLVA